MSADLLLDLGSGRWEAHGRRPWSSSPHHLLQAVSLLRRSLCPGSSSCPEASPRLLPAASGHFCGLRGVSFLPGWESHLLQLCHQFACLKHMHTHTRTQTHTLTHYFKVKSRRRDSVCLPQPTSSKNEGILLHVHKADIRPRKTKSDFLGSSNTESV